MTKFNNFNNSIGNFSYFSILQKPIILLLLIAEDEIVKIESTIYESVVEKSLGANMLLTHYYYININI